MSLAYLTSVESTGPGSGGGATPSIDTTGAALIIVAVCRANNSGTVSDSEGNTWTLLDMRTQGTFSTEWYYTINPTTSATHTFSFVGTNTYPGIIASAYSAAGLPVFDQESAQGGVFTSMTPTSLTPSQNDTLIVSFEGFEITQTQVVTESLAVRHSHPWTTGVDLGVAFGDIVQATAAASDPAWSGGFSVNRIAGQAFFYDMPVPIERKPLIIDMGVIQQIQGIDVIEGAVYHAADLTPDNSIIRADDGGIRDVQVSTASLADTGVLSLVQDSALETSGSHGNILNVTDSAAAESFHITAFTAASKNTGIGLNTGAVITSGVQNTALGSGSGAAFTTCNDCTAIGFNTLPLLSTGSSNLGIGSSAGQSMTNGSNNTLIGVTAGQAITSGIRNTCVGNNAGFALTTQSNCVFIGGSSGNGTTGTQNTAIGVFSAFSLTSGTQNTFIGYTAGHTGQLGTVTNCVGIGTGVVTTKSNQIIIGNASNTETLLRGNVFTGSGAYNTIKRASKTADYTIVDETLILADATSAAMTVTLPAASTLVDTPVHVKKIDSSSNAVTIDGNGSETIDGQLTAAMAVQYTTLTLVSDGTEWWIL